MLFVFKCSQWEPCWTNLSLCLVHVIDLNVSHGDVVGAVPLSNHWIDRLLPWLKLTFIRVLLNHTLVILIEETTHPANIECIVVPHGNRLVHRSLLAEDHILAFILGSEIIITLLGHVCHVAFEGPVDGLVLGWPILLRNGHLLKVCMIGVFWDTWKNIFFTVNIGKDILVAPMGFILVVWIKPTVMVDHVRGRMLDSCVPALIFNRSVVVVLVLRTC